MKKQTKKLIILTLTLLLVITSVAVLTACRNRYEYFTVSFNSHGGSEIASVTTREDRAIIHADAPIKTGHNFIGWFYDSALTRQAIFPLYLEADVTLYANWRGQSRIVFDSGGGTSVPDIVGFTNYHIQAPVSPTRDGYIFAGWYETPDFVRYFHFYEGRQMLGRDITLYARWLSSHRITFSGSEVIIDTGLTVSFLDVVDGAVINTPVAAPTNGYRFDGWRIGNIPAVFPLRITSDIILTAVLTEVFYNVTVNFAGVGAGSSITVNEGNIVVSEHGSRLVLPDAVTTVTETPEFRGFLRDGITPALAYRFDGWYNEATGEIFRDGLPLPVDTQTLELTAVWLQSARFARIDFVVIAPPAGQWLPPHPLPQARTIYLERLSEVNNLQLRLREIVVEGTGQWLFLDSDRFGVEFHQGNAPFTGSIMGNITLDMRVIRRF